MLWDRRLPGASSSVPFVNGQSGIAAALSVGQRQHDGSVAAWLRWSKGGVVVAIRKLTCRQAILLAISGLDENDLCFPPANVYLFKSAFQYWSLSLEHSDNSG
jgi:hypothetical protein